MGGSKCTKIFGGFWDFENREKKGVNTTPEEISVGTEDQTSIKPKGKFDNYPHSGKGIPGNLIPNLY